LVLLVNFYDFCVYVIWIFREPRGFGFVKYRHSEDAAEAKQRMDHKTIGGREIRIVFAEENRKTPQEMRRTTHVRYGKTFLTPVLHRYSVLIASVFFPVQQNTTFTSLAYWIFLNFVSSDRHGGSSRGRTSSRSPRHRHRC
jgi:FUS-interacting serine-arginine-rich protein 1